jgi:DNA-binding NarL/FixJ family response regulator
MKNHNVVIIDDHSLFANSLKVVINDFEGYHVSKCLVNGQELIDLLLESQDHPDIVLLDINMPVLNGLQTIIWLSKHQPNLKVLALSMEDNEETIIKMLRHGAKGYLLKDIHPEELENALNQVIEKGFYYTEKVSNSIISSLHLQSDEKDNSAVDLNDKEKKFLKLACTDKTYREIADIMFLSPKTIDGYRENIFKKFKVGNRIGLVLHAIKHGFIEV